MKLHKFTSLNSGNDSTPAGITRMRSEQMGTILDLLRRLLGLSGNATLGDIIDSLATLEKMLTLSAVPGEACPAAVSESISRQLGLTKRQPSETNF